MWVCTKIHEKILIFSFVFSFTVSTSDDQSYNFETQPKQYSDCSNFKQYQKYSSYIERS